VAYNCVVYEEPVTGRPSLLSEELAAAIANEVRCGVKPARACAIVGIDTDNWYNWLKKFRAKKSPYFERVGKILLAEAAFLGEIEKGVAASGKWEAGAFILKTRARGEYGDKSTDGEPKREGDAAKLSYTKDELIAALAERGLPTTVFGGGK
jgi:hypothetical protein